MAHESRSRDFSRRDVITHAIALAAASLTAPIAECAAAAPRLTDDPFKLLGLASGDPTRTGIVLWTRLAIDLEDGARWGLSEGAYRLRWEVRDLEAAGNPVVKSGHALAAQRNGYAVHVEVDGLRPRRRYGYRFTLGDYGIEGTTRTAPAPSDTPEKLRFAFCSCAEYEYAFHYAYEFMAREEPEFIVHLGDYIYEQTYDQFFRRDFEPPPPRASCEDVLPLHRRVRWLRHDRVGKVRTLSQYRRRYAEYKTDRHLQFAHRHCPFVVTWDDHEVDNDYAGDFSETREEIDFAERRVNAYRAYFENLPIRLSTLPVRENRRRLYRYFDFGTLLRLYMLDERQYRSDQACAKGLRGSGRIMPVETCPEITDSLDRNGERREMLGRRQERWLGSTLAGSRATWNVLAQGIMMAHLDSRADCQFPAVQEKFSVSTDGWSGYLAARQRIIDILQRHRAKNPVLLGGDVHAHFVNRVLKDRKDRHSIVAPEFVCTAISSNLRNWEGLRVPGGGNEHAIVDLDCRNHGYVLCDVTKSEFEVSMKRVFPNAFVPKFEDAKAEVSMTYRVASGDPEPRKV